MKKIYITLISMILLFSLTACQGLNIDNDKDTEQNNDTDSNVEYLDNVVTQNLYVYDPDVKLKFNTWLGKNTFYYFHDIEPDTSFDESEYTDEKAEKELDVEFLGTEYHFEYEVSKILKLTGKKVHTYKGPEINGKVLKLWVDINTDKIIYCRDIPHTVSTTTTTEAEYKELIQSMVGDDMDLSDCLYSPRTTYGVSSEGYIEGESVNDFHVMAENESLIYYEFNFYKCESEMKTASRVQAYFTRSNVFDLAIYEYGYPQDTFKPITSRKEELDNSVLEYVRSHVKDEYDIKDLRIEDTVLFIRDGKMYVASYFWLEVYTDSTHFFAEPFDGYTISELVPDNS